MPDCLNLAKCPNQNLVSRFVLTVNCDSGVNLHVTNVKFYIALSWFSRTYLGSKRMLYGGIDLAELYEVGLVLGHIVVGILVKSVKL